MTTSKIHFVGRVESVDERLGTMMIRFTSPGRRDILVGALCPAVGVREEEYIPLFAPIQSWIDDERQFYAPKIGVEVAGVYTLPEEQDSPSLPFSTPVRAQSAAQSPAHAEVRQAGEPGTGGFPTRYVPSAPAPFTAPASAFGRPADVDSTPAPTGMPRIVL